MRGHRPFAALEQCVVEAFASVPAGGIALACSGGPDSVALVAAAAACSRRAKRRFVVLHVNHAVRSSADRDEGVAMAVAAHANMPFRGVVLSHDATELASPEHSEASLRDRRYAALSEMASSAGCAAVATAHTLEDQVETVLLALVRGAGLHGLAGMPERRPLCEGLELLRPLLGHSHGELAAYAHAAGVPYALDETNEDTRYRRNRLRGLLAELRAMEPSADEAIGRLAHLAREEDTYLDQRAAEALATLTTHEERLAGRIRRIPRPLLRRVLRLWLGGRDLDFEHLDQLAAAVAEGRDGRFFVRKGEEVVIRAGYVKRLRVADG